MIKFKKSNLLKNNKYKSHNKDQKYNKLSIVRLENKK